MRSLFRTATRPHIVKSALKVALVVGTVLNLINQGERKLSGESIAWMHAILNYFVPFWVSSYSVAKNEMARGDNVMSTETGRDALLPETILNDGVFIEDLRRQMVKFASLQLSDAYLAEDAVQEALAGALVNAKGFAGRSALKTWVFAILKNKIADVLRQKKRLINASSLLREDEENEDFTELLFDQKGFWQPDERPAPWGNPEVSFQQQQFWTVFEACLESLPAKQARVFMMREFVELETDEICAAAGITVSNLFVILHRARLRLQVCLENKWYLNGERSC